MSHGLSEQTVAVIAGVLRQIPEIEKVILYGSRAKGCARRGSDIDLALVGPNIDLKVLGRLEDALDQSPLPYKFTLTVLSDVTDPDLLSHINRAGKPFYDRTTTAATLPAEATSFSSRPL